MSKCDRILHHLLWFRTGLKRIQKCRRFPTMSNFGVAMAILCNFEIYEICSNEFNVYQDVDIWGWDSADMKKTGAIWSQERSSQTMVVVADWDGTSWSQNTTLPCFGRLRSASVGMCEDVDDFYLWEHDLHRFQEDCMYDHMYIYICIYIYAVCLKIHTGPERQRLSSFVSKKFNDSNHRYFPIQSPRLGLWEHLHSHPLKMGGSSEGLPVDFL